jgi:hypothetical protein
VFCGSIFLIYRQYLNAFQVEVCRPSPPTAIRGFRMHKNPGAGAAVRYARAPIRQTAAVLRHGMTGWRPPDKKMGTPVTPASGRRVSEADCKRVKTTGHRDEPATVMARCWP